MSNSNSAQTIQKMESTVHDAVGEILDEQFEDIQNAIVCRVLKRLKLAAYTDEREENGVNDLVNGCNDGINSECTAKETEHKMFDPIAGP